MFCSLFYVRYNNNYRMVSVMAASCENLIGWLNTLDYPETIKSVQDLSNGVILSKFLKNICPKFFDDEWQLRIKNDFSNNWRIKASNLKKVLKGILDYYSQELQLSLPEHKIPDVTIIAEKEDEKEMTKLLQLLLGCAVNCENKHHYIQKIMDVEEDIQHSVMISIKELMLTESSHNEIDLQASSSSAFEFKKLQNEKNSLEERCQELDQQLVILCEEKQNLKIENAKLNERLNQVDLLEDPSTPLGRRMQQLQKQIEHLQEELFKSETGKDDYRIKCEILERDLKQLQTKNEALNKLSEDSRMMKDELDVLRHNSDKVIKYEMTISNLRKKLEDLSDLKGQVKLFEEKSYSYVERNLELEEELKKTSIYKSQLELYMRQTHDLEMKVTEENKKVDKFEFELSRCHDKIAGLQMEKERLIQERDGLKEINEEIKFMSVAANQFQTFDDGEDIEVVDVPPHIREKVIKLQHQLKMMESSRQHPEDVYKKLIENANNRRSELEEELRTQNRRIFELEAKVEDLEEVNRSLMSEPSSPPTMKSTEHFNEKSAELMNNDDMLKNELIEVNKKLLDKEAEMKTMEQKYKQYLEKAKMLINHHQANILPDVAVLEEKLADKENVIQVLENKLKAQEAEQKLISSAFYNMSMNLHKRNVEDRISKGCTSLPPPFLTRQRNVQSRRISSGASH